MLVRNENYQEVDLNSILSEILNDYQHTPNVDVSEKEAKEALAQMYGESNIIANQHFFKNKNYAMPAAQAELKKWPVITMLWKLFEEKVCPKFDEETEQEKIAEIVADAIGEILPGKIFITRLLKIIIFYILKNGHQNLCSSKE